ncbi:MAG: putative aspartate aminotransferase 2 [Methanosaeta sp. PtaU1.Bin060]|nr:MAG: putative aspartate aminotransferase 2 [Methanosaeta sp. PtaU1.Bin060]
MKQRMKNIPAWNAQVHLNQVVSAMPPSGIRRFFDLVSEMEGAISLGVGEPDFVTPWHVREACIYSLESGNTHYTSNRGMPELRECICERAQREMDLEYDPAHDILITTGVSEAVDLAFRATLNPRDEVIVPEPCYVAYTPDIILAGGVPKTVPTLPEDEFRLQPETVSSAITERTRAVLLSYPNNPTGTIMTRSDLEDLADVVVENDLLVISDEVYSKLSYSGSHSSFAQLEGMKDRTLILNGLSKSHAMTGWRIGYVLGDPALVGAMTKVHQYTMLCAPTMAQVAALEAMEKGDEEMLHMRHEYDLRRRLFVSGLNRIGLSCFEPRGAFYAFPSIRATGLSSEKFAEKLLKEQKVAVVPGSVFGASGEGFLRCSYATSREELIEALDRMETFLGGL